ncbi:MAG: AtpZ/AtpI family protein [Acidobacteriota bacterium]|nr:AtpZ/AtpI family protein [Acidobacteriota bacterium]
MIKNLLDADENPPEGTKVVIEETVVESPPTDSSVETNPVENTAKAEDTLETAPSFDDTQNAAEISVASADTTNFPPIAEAFSETSKLENKEPTIFQNNYQPESTAETMRKSGLAYAAAITLFAAVVFMMILGWFADLLLGSSPWGIVVGIVLGAVIGFIQFFRLTSQILKNKE